MIKTYVWGGGGGIAIKKDWELHVFRVSDLCF